MMAHLKNYIQNELKLPPFKVFQNREIISVIFFRRQSYKN